MAVDFSAPVREAVMRVLAVSPLTALVPVGSQYRGTVPAGRTFPFTRYGAPIAVPLRTSGLDSSTIRFRIHSHTKALLGTSGEVLVPAEDRSHAIAAAIVGALGDRVLLLGDRTATVVWISTDQSQDTAEADEWHATCLFQADVAG